MAFPICDECARSGVLCNGCVQKVREGKVTELDVLVSGLLAHAGARGYESLADFETKLVIFASDDDTTRIIGPGGKSVAELSKKLGRRIVVVSKSWDKDLIIKSLARPSRVVAESGACAPKGEGLKLIFDKPIDEGSLKLIKELAGDVKIEYQPYQK